MFDEQRFHDKMAALERRHDELTSLLGDPEIIGRRGEFQKLSREHADLAPLLEAWRGYRKLRTDLDAAKQLLVTESDADLREMAKDEVRTLEEQQGAAEQALKLLLLPKNPDEMAMASSSSFAMSL